MNRIIRQVLEKLENNGFEAYIIGGYVRDLLVGTKGSDIDICTNATPKELIGIFKYGNTKNLGGIDFNIKEYHFEITTYREELKYSNRRPVKYNYINSLIEDLKRRDFTINAICMNKKGELIDLIGGSKDIQEQRVRMIGDIKLKLKEDPLRILRAIRIATKLNFGIESSLYKALKEKHMDILKLSNTRIKEELDKILISSNVRNGFRILEDLGITKDLGISGYHDLVYVNSLEGMYAQLKINYDLPFSKQEKINIDNLKKILKIGSINKRVVYKYGLYLCMIAGEIKGVDKKSLNKMDKELAIHDKSEINIDSLYIINNFDIKGREISRLLSIIEMAIVDGELKNKRNDIIKYIKKEVEMKVK